MVLKIYLEFLGVGSQLQNIGAYGVEVSNFIDYVETVNLALEIWKYLILKNANLVPKSIFKNFLICL